MKQEERASIIRVVSDLIKADGIIDTREIDFLDDLREKYGITRMMRFCGISESGKSVKHHCYDRRKRQAFINE